MISKPFQKLEERANYYGYELRDISSDIGYRDRKGKTYGLFDRRDGRMLCSYATLGDVERVLKKQVKNYLWS